MQQPHYWGSNARLRMMEFQQHYFVRSAAVLPKSHNMYAIGVLRVTLVNHCTPNPPSSLMN
jgi:hypothetical protein